MEALQNEQGQAVYPTAAGAFLDDTKAIYSDEEYNRLKPGASDSSPMTTDSAQSEGTPPVTNEGGQQAATPVGEAAVEEQAAAPSESSAATTPDFDALLAEYTGGKIAKKEDLLAKLDEKPTLEFANDTTRKIAEALKEGNTDEVLEYLNKQNLLKAAEGADDAFRIKLKMQLENPDWEGADIDDEYERLYGLTVNEDLADPARVEREKRAIERRLKADGKAAMEFLNLQREGLALPEFGSKAPAIDEIPEVKAYKELQSEIEETNKAFFEAIDKDVANLGAIDLSVSDKDVQFTHQFEIPQEERAALAEKAKNFWTEFKESYHGDDGWKAKKLMQDQYIVQNLPKIIKSAVTAAMNQKGISLVKGLANADNGASGGVAADLAAEAAREEMRRFITA